MKRWVMKRNGKEERTNKHILAGEGHATRRLGRGGSMNTGEEEKEEKE